MPERSLPPPGFVDATTGHLMLSYMDTFSGYNQIKMAPEDREKTSIIKHRGVYYYKAMPFGLINALFKG